MNLITLFVLPVAIGLGGCVSSKVEPWEKDVLARPNMAADDAPLSNALDDHIYFSKEGTSGGRGFAGGGCGCN